VEQQQSKWSAFVEKLGTEYRLSILQEETFEQLTNHRLPLWKMVGTVVGGVVLVVLITVAAIIYTPLKGPVLSYVTKIETTDIVVLNQTIDKLEKKIKAHETYEASMRTILLGGAASERRVSSESNISNITLPNATPMSKESTSSVKTVRVNSRNIDKLAVNLTPPISGSISAKFMPEKSHYGVDVVAPKNTPVKAVMDGFVISSDWTIDTGNTIGVQHANGYVSFYKHNSSLLKKSGSPVKAGEAIAIIGNTGRLTDGPHLHFELWHNGKPINPTDYINFQ
jgi:murein DD-endopeptidase MepM/ murein hydrolase activator NlpD